jgi:hypothetical protein
VTALGAGLACSARCRARVRIEDVEGAGWRRCADCLDWYCGKHAAGIASGDSVFWCANCGAADRERDEQSDIA